MSIWSESPVHYTLLYFFSVYHKIQPKEGSIGFTLDYDFKISLNGSSEYVVYINDPKFGFPTINPETVPSTSFLLSKSSLTILFIKVKKLKSYPQRELTLISGCQTKQTEYSKESLHVITWLRLSQVPGEKTDWQKWLSTFMARH